MIANREQRLRLDLAMYRINKTKQNRKRVESGRLKTKTVLSFVCITCPLFQPHHKNRPRSLSPSSSSLKPTKTKPKPKPSVKKSGSIMLTAAINKSKQRTTNQWTCVEWRLHVMLLLCCICLCTPCLCNHYYHCMPVVVMLSKSKYILLCT